MDTDEEQQEQVAGGEFCRVTHTEELVGVDNKVEGDNLELTGATHTIYSSKTKDLDVTGEQFLQSPTTKK